MSIDQAETARPTLDEDKVEAFAGQVVTDISTVLAGATTYIGHDAGLYAAIAEGEPLTPDELAERAGAHPRCVSEWLGAQAAGGYVDYDPDSGAYRLPPEHAVLVDTTSPAYLGGGNEVMAGIWAAADRGWCGASSTRRPRPTGWRPPVAW